MDTARRWNDRPYHVAVLHGGPGAAGEMAPVARTLSASRGVLEPFQSEQTPGGQVEELAGILREQGDPPVTIIGFSWGAFLGFLLAARHPRLVRNLILIGSPPFEDTYAGAIGKTRLSRLSPQEQDEARTLSCRLLDLADGQNNDVLVKYGALMARADAFDPVFSDEPAVKVRFDLFRNVWSGAEELRRSGTLLQLGTAISCPVLAIHGDHDPHPAEGVREPLTRTLTDFRFILLKKCGHRPWTERFARDAFYTLLEREFCKAGTGP